MDRIDLKKIGEEVVGLEEITVSQDIEIIDDHDEVWVDDRSKPEVEFDDEQQQSYEQNLTNLRVLELFRNDVGPKGDQCHDSRCRSWKHEIHENRTRGSLLGCPGRATTHSGFQARLDIWYATDGDVDGFFSSGSGGRTHNENLLIKN